MKTSKAWRECVRRTWDWGDKTNAAIVEKLLDDIDELKAELKRVAECPSKTCCIVCREQAKQALEEPQ